MDDLLTTKEIIETAAKENIYLGKGDPYNRLRYYTKMGWIPHMVRKAEQSGKTVGHYPKNILDSIKQINQFKKQGLSNEEITKEIAKLEKKQALVRTIKDSSTKKSIVIYLSIAVLILVILSESGILPIGRTKNLLSINSAVNQDLELPHSVVLTDSGRKFIPASKNNQIFVESNKVSTNSKIHVTFETDYAPATRYWVALIVPGQGFFVELDAPLLVNAQFSWWVTN